MATTEDPRFPAATAGGTIAFRGHETWSRVTGDLHAEQAPLVVLHGGPGVGHNYCLMMTNLAEDGRAVVHDDQLGCGGSTHLPDAPEDSWTVEPFVDELRTLVAALGIEQRFHLLGRSWGGMLAPEVVLADASGVASLTVCDSPASMPLWIAAAGELREELPPETAATLTAHEEAGTTGSPEYAAAVQAEPTVHHAMNGPSELHVIGSLRDWSVVERLHLVDVPTLVVAGAHDEAAPSTWQPFVDTIPDVRSHVSPDSSHLPHVEEPEASTRVVGAFLRDHD